MSGINNYFSNNNIFNGTEIPTQGKFDVGDIIVNIGENAEEEPMWMCIEAGEPGVWKVVGKVEDIDLSGYQEKTDENLATKSKDLVGAINELFQSANNGKELIANAIGEPLSSNDTFSAMSTDINGLLSTFKTNMMNNGITVESGDKFKSLIDKIATMVEEGSGKGIQFASGTVSASSQIGYVLLQGTNGHTSNSGYLVEITSLSFKPMIVLLANSDDTPVVAAYNNECFINLENGYRNMEMATLTSSVENMTNLKLLYNGFRLATKNTGLYTYYAIGVGEEDTTLRDSLASILENKGVSVVPEDDMASLVAKVDNIEIGRGFTTFDASFTIESSYTSAETANIPIPSNVKRPFKLAIVYFKDAISVGHSQNGTSPFYNASFIYDAEMHTLPVEYAYKTALNGLKYTMDIDDTNIIITMNRVNLANPKTYEVKVHLYW